MPKTSVKSKLLEYLIESAVFEAVEEGKELDDRIDQVIAAQSFRYGAPFTHGIVEKSDHWRKYILPQLNGDRVRVEHYIGLLKEHFSSLKELKVKISDEESAQHACNWLTVTCILHNIIRSLKNDSIDGFSPSENPTDDEDVETSENSFENSEGVKKEQIMNLII